MLQLFFVAIVLCTSVLAEDPPKAVVSTIAPFNYGPYHHLDAYKHHPYNYDASKFPFQYGGYPHHSSYNYGAYGFPDHAAYSNRYGLHPYQAAGYRYPYAGVYNNAPVTAKP
ncbi:hypothetical protein FQR65_LT07174 [Abscondita terminalis]|nr:hypothetical protein FQR65_LT07174 [Abscondita terminalis]